MNKCVNWQRAALTLCLSMACIGWLGHTALTHAQESKSDKAYAPAAKDGKAGDSGPPGDSPGDSPGGPPGGNSGGNSGGGGGGGGPPMGPPPAMVRTAPIRREKVQELFEVIGRLQEVRRAVVAAEQSGRVLEVTAEEGSAVEGGKTVLARIDDIWMKLSLKVAEAKIGEMEAAIAETKVGLEQAARDRKYIEDLRAANSAKPKELDDAKSKEQAEAAKLDRDKAALESAKAELVRAKENMTRLSPVAPFDGVVVKKLTEVGQWLEPGKPVAEIVSRGTIDALVHVPERFINSLAVGSPVEVRVESLNATVTGKVASITPQASTAARTFPVKIRLDDTGMKLKPGMSATALVPTGKAMEAITVPRDAVTFSANGASMWLALGSAAVPANVKVLFGQGGRYVVAPASEGGPPLAEGVQVVVEGGERLFPGQPLIPMAEPLKGNASAPPTPTTKPAL